MRTVTILLPNGYASPEEFAKDCGFELAPNSHDALVAALATIADIAEGSGTLNSFPNIAKIARGALASIKETA